MITIKTEKVVQDSGIKGRKLLKFSCLGFEQLPELYLNHHPYIFSRNNSLVVCGMKGDGSFPLTEGQWVTEEFFQELIAFLQACGKRLAATNSELKKSREEWNGEETFFI